MATKKQQSLEKYVQNIRVIKRRSIMVRTFVVVALVISCLCVASMLIKQNGEFERLSKERQELEYQYNQAQLAKEQANQEANRAGTDEFIEQVARDELGLAKPNELIFK